MPEWTDLNPNEHDTYGEDTVRVWVVQAYGHKFTKQQEYGMQVAFSEEPDADWLAHIRNDIERQMRSESITGDIRWEYLTYLALDKEAEHAG